MTDSHKAETAAARSRSRWPELKGRQYGTSWNVNVYPGQTGEGVEKEVSELVKSMVEVAGFSDAAFEREGEGRCVYMMGSEGEVLFSAETECSKFHIPLRCWVRNVLLWARRRPVDVAPEGERYYHVDFSLEGIRDVRSLHFEARHDCVPISWMAFSRTAEDYFGEFFGSDGKEGSFGAGRTFFGMSPWDLRELAPWGARGLSIVSGGDTVREDLNETEAALLEKIGEGMTDLADALRYDDEIFVFCMNAIGEIKDGNFSPGLSTYTLFMLACIGQAIKMRTVGLKVELERWHRYKFEFAKLVGIEPLVAKMKGELDEVFAERIADARDSGDVVEPSSAGLPKEGAPLIDFLKSFFDDYIEDSKTFLAEMVKVARADGDEDGVRRFEARIRMFD